MLSLGGVSLIGAGTELFTRDDARRVRRIAQEVPPELEDYLSEEDAGEALAIAIDWGRYAELFEYDDATGVFSMPLEVSRPAAPRSRRARPSRT